MELFGLKLSPKIYESLSNEKKRVIEDMVNRVENICCDINNILKTN